MNLQRHIFNLIEKRNEITRRGIVIQVILAGLIVASTTAAIWETMPGLNPSTLKWLLYTQNICGAIFLVEYVLRLWVAPLHFEKSPLLFPRFKFALRPMMLIDLVVLLPFILPHAFAFDASMLRIMRLIRILRIARFGSFSKSLNSLSQVLKNSGPELVVSMSLSFALFILASSGIYYFEREAQPQTFSSIPDSMWWATNALTGLWLGDIFPITLGGKIFGGLIALLAVGTVALPAGIIASGILSAVEQNKKSLTETCPTCGRNKSELKEAA